MQRMSVMKKSFLLQWNCWKILNNLLININVAARYCLKFLLFQGVRYNLGSVQMGYTWKYYQNLFQKGLLD